MRSADDFDAIRERIEELRQESIPVPTCPLTLTDCVQACAVDDHSTIFCKKAADGGKAASGWYNCPYEQSWAVRRNRM